MQLIRLAQQADDAGGSLPGGLWQAISTAFLGVAAILAGVYVRRDNRAGKAEEAATHEHVATTTQWDNLVTSLQQQLKEADERCQRQMAQLRADLESAMARERTQLQFQLEQANRRIATLEGRQAGDM